MRFETIVGRDALGSRPDKAEIGMALRRRAAATAQLDAAELILFDAIGQLDAVGATGKQMTALEAARNRAQCAQVIELIHASAEKLMFMAGSSAFMLNSPLSRYWRDVSMALRHVQNIPPLGYEIYGRDMLEVSPNISPVGAY